MTASPFRIRTADIACKVPTAIQFLQVAGESTGFGDVAETTESRGASPPGKITRRSGWR
jgi:hypothetical protein